MRKSWRQIKFAVQVQKENRCEQSISQRGSSGCVDCTEIMYSAVQNGKSTRRRRRRGGGGEIERTRGLSVSLPHVALHRSRIPLPSSG